jgi:multisubunit Na+/H+ antiporter MnhF subunit
MLLGSTGIATLLILSVDDIGPGLLDAALALAVLAPVSTAAFLVSRQAVRDRTRGSHVE